MDLGAGHDLVLLRGPPDGAGPSYTPGECRPAVFGGTDLHSTTVDDVPRRGSGVPLLVGAGIAWGTGGLLGSLLGRETGLSPLAVAAYRLGLGGLLVLLVVSGLALGRRRDRPLLGAPHHRRTARRRIGLLAVLAAAFQACYFTAVSLTTVGLATLVTIGTAPVVVVAVETVRGQARRGALPVVVLALLGLGLLVGVPTDAPDPVAALAGAGAAVLAGSAFATMTLVAATAVPGLDALTATGASFVVGGLLLAVPAALLGGPAVPTTLLGVGLLALFAVVPTALAYSAYFRGLATGTSAGTGAVLALLEPLTAAVLAAIVLGERLGVVGTAGALLLGVAVLLAARADRRPPFSRAVSAAARPTSGPAAPAGGSGPARPDRRPAWTDAGRPSAEAGRVARTGGSSRGCRASPPRSGAPPGRWR